MATTEYQNTVESFRNHLIVMGTLVLALVLRSCSVEAASPVREAGLEFPARALSLDSGAVETQDLKEGDP